MFPTETRLRKQKSEKENTRRRYDRFKSCRFSGSCLSSIRGMVQKTAFCLSEKTFRGTCRTAVQRVFVYPDRQGRYEHELPANDSVRTQSRTCRFHVSRRTHKRRREQTDGFVQVRYGSDGYAGKKSDNPDLYKAARTFL